MLSRLSQPIWSYSFSKASILVYLFQTPLSHVGYFCHTDKHEVVFGAIQVDVNLKVSPLRL